MVNISDSELKWHTGNVTEAGNSLRYIQHHLEKFSSQIPTKMMHKGIKYDLNL